MGISHVFDSGALSHPPDEPDEREWFGILFKKVKGDRIYQDHWVSDTEPSVRVFPYPHTMLHQDDLRWIVLTTDGEQLEFVAKDFLEERDLRWQAFTAASALVRRDKNISIKY